MATVKLNDQWVVQLGITDGHDVSVMDASDAKPSGTACLNYTTTSVNDNLYVCANGINDGKYAYNNLQQYDATWYHKFSKTWHMATGKPGTCTSAMCLPLGGTIQPEVGAESRLLSARGAAVHGSRIRQQSISCRRNCPGPATFCRFAAIIWTTRRASAPAIATRYTEEHDYVVSLDRHNDPDTRPELRFERAWDMKAYDYVDLAL